VGNLWLFSQLGEHPSPSPAIPKRETSASTYKAPDAAAPVAPTESAANRATKLVQALVNLDSNDLAASRDQLRAAGADAATVYAVIDGMLRMKNYRAKRILEAESIRQGWWRGNPADMTAPNYPRWGGAVVSPLLDLVGYDPHDITDFSSRLDFLPPEKAQMLAKMAVDYRASYLQSTEGARETNAAAMNLVFSEKQKDIQNLLTPEERAEYDLRFSDASSQNTQRFAKMQATEAEFRAIEPMMERLQNETRALSRDQNNAAAANALTQSAFDQLVATVGYDRALDYTWGGTRIMTRDLTTGNIQAMPAVPNSSQLMQLAAETGAAAAAIHYDSSLSLEAKRAALLALQQSTQPALDKILPPDTRANVDPQAFGWFTGLSKGEYVMTRPSLLGNSIMISTPTSVATPMRGNPPIIPLPKPTR